MAKIVTTTKKLKQEGVQLADGGTEIHWESTGHLSVRLLDASGSHPLVGRAVKVDVPGEGTVHLETDEDGELSYPDVPFQDYELDIGGRSVVVPAVGDRSEVHERHVSESPMGFFQAVLYDARGTFLDGVDVEVKFASGASVATTTDNAGIVRCHHLDADNGDVEISCERGRATAKSLASPQKVMRVDLREWEST